MGRTIMATKKKDGTKSDTLEAIGVESRKAIDAIAKGMGVAAVELWSIFVRQSVVRGVSELFTAIVLFGFAFFLKDYIGFWALVPTAIGIALCYGTIHFIGNPKYYALNDITKRIGKFKDDQTKKSKTYY